MYVLSVLNLESTSNILYTQTSYFSRNSSRCRQDKFCIVASIYDSLK